MWGVLADGFDLRARDGVPADVAEETRRILSRVGYNGAQSISRELSQLASQVLRRLLVDPFGLNLEVGTPEELVAGTHPRWLARSGDSGDGDPWLIGLERLSRAQARWASLAVRIAIRHLQRREQHADGENWLWIIDEPETGLHRSAEEYMARGLLALAQEYGAHLVVSTHSPELLDDPRAHVMRASIDGRETAITRLDDVDRSALDSLGLRPSDMLRRQRAFILVEGEHEVAIFNALFGDDLRTMRAQVIPARGASKFTSVLESQLLFRYTDAKVILVIDNQNAYDIQAIWSRARQRAQQGDVEAAADAVRAELPKRGSAENLFLQEFMTKALATGDHERIEVFGFNEPDIVDYLPCAEFGPFSTWFDARAAWKGSGTKDPFKQWLTRAHRADFSPSRVGAVASQMDSIPHEFASLLAWIAVTADPEAMRG
jgi:energy-coupling factor transporter ATP-binding protein EcfA2